MKKISEAMAYTVPAETLLAVFKDKTFYEKRYEAAGITDYKIVACEEKEGAFHINIEREMAVNLDNMPRMARKFVGESITMNIIMNWQAGDEAPFKGDYEVLMGKVPVDAKGSMLLENTDDGCINTVNLNVECGIPLVGKKVEDMIAKKAQRGMVKDGKGTMKYIEANNIT